MSNAHLTKPESVGDIIGQSVRLYRANFFLIFQSLILPTVVFAFSRLTIQFAATQHPSFSLTNPANYIGLAGIILFLSALWYLTLKQIAVTTYLTGYAVSEKVAFDRIFKKQMQVFGCVWLSGIAFMINGIAWLVTAVIAAFLYKFAVPDDQIIGALVIVFATIFGVMVGAFVITAFGGFSLFTLCVEDMTFVRVMQTAGVYVMDNFRRTTLFVAAVGICISALMPPLFAPPAVLIALEYWRFALVHGRNLMQPSPYLLVFTQVWESFVNMILWPLFFFCLALFYRDLNVRKRASDITAKLDQLNYSEA